MIIRVFVHFEKNIAGLFYKSMLICINIFPRVHVKHNILSLSIVTWLFKTKQPVCHHMTCMYLHDISKDFKIFYQVSLCKLHMQVGAASCHSK